MGSSNEEKRYPPRLYKEGKSPLQRRSMHHNCILSSFVFMKECIGEKVYNDIRDNSQVGVILKLADSDYVWWAKLVHHILTRQLAIDRRYEMWALIEGSPIRFSLYEFEDITGLNCETIDEEDKVVVDHIAFWEELKVDGGVGPNWYELDEALKVCKTWGPEKRKMIELLFVLHVGILGIAKSSRIPLEYAKRVVDGNAFERFPWGRVGFRELIQSIKIVSFENNGYAIHGCVHVLMIWALDCLVNLGKKHGNKRESGDDEGEVPLLSWGGGRPRISVADFLAREKQLHKKVQVHHLSIRRKEEIYPFWAGENAVFGEGVGGNKLLDNLLHDIIEGCVDEKHWHEDDETVVVEKKRMEKRKQLASSSDDFVDPPQQKVGKVSKGGNRQFERKSKGAASPMDNLAEDRDGESETSRSGKGSISDVIKLLCRLTAKVDTIAEQQTNLEKKVVDLEREVVQLKESKIGNDGKDVFNSNYGNNERKVVNDWEVGNEANDGFQGEELARRTRDTGENKDAVDTESTTDGGNLSGGKDEMKQTSQDEYPITSCVRNPMKRKSRLSLTNIRREVALRQQEEELDQRKLMTSLKDPADLLTKHVDTDGDSPVGRPMIKKVGSVSEKKKVDVTGSGHEKEKYSTNTRKEVQMPSMDSQFSDPIEVQARKNIGPAINQFYVLSKQGVSNPPLCPPEKCRQRKLASTQLHPYVGSSVVKRILKGKVLSPAHYDPFEKVSAMKVQNLMEFIDKDLEDIFDSSNSSANFYLPIMTPKEMWPLKDKQYGWLKDAHLCPIMQMLRKRSMQPISPFLSDRITFLDHWFVNQWAQDYKRFDTEKKWLWPDWFIKVYNGQFPSYAPTNKRWVEDVDIIYLAHNMNNDHWVAVEVHLMKRRVKVYDSICSMYKDEEVAESCKQYTRMIPALIQALAPPDAKKQLGAAAFSFYRIKTTPQNFQTGDCGVYAIKFIECLAIGITFEGLSDAAMPALRLKLAAEVYDEVPDVDCFIQKSDPNPRGSETGCVEFISQTRFR